MKNLLSIFLLFAACLNTFGQTEADAKKSVIQTSEGVKAAEGYKFYKLKDGRVIIQKPAATDSKNQEVVVYGKKKKREVEAVMMVRCNCVKDCSGCQGCNISKVGDTVTCNGNCCGLTTEIIWVPKKILEFETPGGGYF